MSRASNPTAAVEAVLQRRLGWSLDALGKGAARRIILRRCQAAGCGVAEYAARLAAGGTELDALVEALVVPETWFLRERTAFDELGPLAARTCARHGFVRVLSAPCSTGEEAWSAAGILRLHALPPAAFEVVGVDVSARALAVARAAVYPASSFRPPSGDLARGWCDANGSVLPELRRSVRFQQANLVSGEGVADLGAFHVILCRNLLIYLATPARSQLAATLDRLLAPEGVVFVGATESLGAPFERSGRPESAAFRRKGASTRTTPGKIPATRVDPPPTASPPVAPVDRLPRARELADAGLHEAAARLLDEITAETPERAQAWALLGFVRLASGDGAAAVRCLERAVRLAPQDQESSFQLELLYERRGEYERAAALRRARRPRSG